MLDFSTLQAFADKVLGMVKIVTFASKQLEIVVGKEKILVTSFFFNVLNNLLFQDCCNSGLKCIAFNPFPNKPWFLCVCSTSLFIDIATELNFSFSHSVFNSFGKLSAICIQLKNCRLQTLSLEESKICHLGKG